MSGRIVLVTAVGEAPGAKAAAAALACTGSDPERPGLLIDVGGRVPRPTLLASAGARELEARLAAHLPQLRAASRGQTCHLAIDDDLAALESIRAAAPLARDSVAVVRLPPGRLREALAEPGLDIWGALLCADIAKDRALTAVAAGDLIGRGLRVRVLGQPLAWISARRALFGISSLDSLPAHVRDLVLKRAAGTG
jgi:hypothetical protein